MNKLFKISFVHCFIFGYTVSAQQHYEMIAKEQNEKEQVELASISVQTPEMEHKYTCIEKWPHAVSKVRICQSEHLKQHALSFWVQGVTVARNRLFIIKEARAYVYNIESEELLKVLPATGYCNHAVSKDGSLFAFIDHEGDVRVWDVSSGMLRVCFSVGTRIIGPFLAFDESAEHLMIQTYRGGTLQGVRVKKFMLATSKLVEEEYEIDGFALSSSFIDWDRRCYTWGEYQNGVKVKKGSRRLPFNAVHKREVNAFGGEFITWHGFHGLGMLANNDAVIKSHQGLCIVQTDETALRFLQYITPEISDLFDAIEGQIEENEGRAVLSPAQRIIFNQLPIEIQNNLHNNCTIVFGSALSALYSRNSQRCSDAAAGCLCTLFISGVITIAVLQQQGIINP